MVDVLNPRLMPPPPIAAAPVIVGLVGPDTEASTASRESQPVPLLLLMLIKSSTLSLGGPSGQPKTLARPWHSVSKLLPKTDRPPTLARLARPSILVSA